MTKLEKIRMIGFIVLVGFFIAVVQLYINGIIFRMPWPYSSFLFQPHDTLQDFNSYTILLNGLDPYHTTRNGAGANYPPFGYFCMLPFVMFGTVTGGGLYLISMLLGFWWFLWRHFSGDRTTTARPSDWLWAFFCIGTMSYPLLFTVDRLNSEGLIFLLIAGFFLSYQKKNTMLAVVLLSAATAAKLYPGLFILLLLIDRRFKEIVYFGLMVIGWSVLAMLVFRTSPSEILASIASTAPYYENQMTYHSFMTRTSTCLLSWIRVVQYFFMGEAAHDQEFMRATLKIYHWLVVIPAGVAVWGIVSRKTQVWEKLVILAVSIIVLPSVSYDYKLIHLFLPFVVFLNSDTDPKTGFIYSLLFGLSFIPKGWTVLFEEVNLNVFLNPLVLVAMAALPIIKTFQKEAAIQPASKGLSPGQQKRLRERRV